MNNLIEDLRLIEAKFFPEPDSDTSNISNTIKVFVDSKSKLFINLWISGKKIKSDYKPMPSGSVSIDISDKRILLHGNRPLINPEVSSIIVFLNTIKYIKSWPIYSFRSMSGAGKIDGKKIKGTVHSLFKKVKTVSTKSPKLRLSIFNRDEEEFEDYEFQVIKHLRDIVFYHVTLEKNLKSIMRKGLLPSGSSEASGWAAGSGIVSTIHNAVYLTSNDNYVSKIIDAMIGQYGENVAVLKIRGSALKHLDKIVSDEDVFYDSGAGAFSSHKLKQDLPQFISGLTSSLESIGYRDKIPPNKIKIDEIIKADEYE